MMPMIPPSAATPSPTYAQSMLVMPRTIVRSASPWNAPKRPNAMLKTVVLVTVLAGCGAAHRGYDSAKVAVIDCGKPAVPTAAALVARWAVEDALAGKIDWAKHETDATGFGLGVGTCAYAELIAAFRKKPTVQALSTGAAPDDGSAGLARLANGAQVKLADGTIVQ